MVVEQGFLFHRVHVKGARIAVDHRVQGAVPVHLVAAVAAVAWCKNAVVRARLALDIRPELEVVRRLPHPAPLAPEGPQLVVGRVALEHLRRGFRIAEVEKALEPRAAAAHTRAREGRSAACDRAAPGDRSGYLCLIHPHRIIARYSDGTTWATTRMPNGACIALCAVRAVRSSARAPNPYRPLMA